MYVYVCLRLTPCALFNSTPVRVSRSARDRSFGDNGRKESACRRAIHIETSHNDLSGQIRQLALLTSRKIQQREVLQPQHALRNDQTLPVGQETVTVARVPYPDFWQREGPPVRRDTLEPNRRGTLTLGVEDEAPVGRPDRIGNDRVHSVDQAQWRSAIHWHLE